MEDLEEVAAVMPFWQLVADLHEGCLPGRLSRLIGCPPLNVPAKLSDILSDQLCADVLHLSC